MWFFQVCISQPWNLSLGDGGDVEEEEEDSGIYSMI